MKENSLFHYNHEKGMAQKKNNKQTDIHQMIIKKSYYMHFPFKLAKKSKLQYLDDFINYIPDPNQSVNLTMLQVNVL